MAFAAAGATVAATGWSGQAGLLPAALLFPFLFGLAPHRTAVAALSLGYFLCASRGLPRGTAAYFGTDILSGHALWLAASFVFVVVHVCCWRHRADHRPFGMMLATILMAVPPFGVVGWASPLTAAGILFPGLGWWGLAATFGLLATLAHPKLRNHALIALVVLSGTAQLYGPDPKPATDWTGIDTEVVHERDHTEFDRSWNFLTQSSSAIRQTDAPYVLLPEGAAGWRTETSERAWTDLAAVSGRTILAGAEVSHGQGSDNVLIRFGPAGWEVVYRQRMPVPLAMWKPWSTRTTHAHMFDEPVVRIAGRPTAVLICYEQLLVWPILQSRLAGADHILGPANSWWAKDTGIPAIQKSALMAWAKLFEMDLTMAFNR